MGFVGLGSSGFISLFLRHPAAAAASLLRPCDLCTLWPREARSAGWCRTSKACGASKGDGNAPSHCLRGQTLLQPSRSIVEQSTLREPWQNRRCVRQQWPRVHPFAQKATQEPSVAVATKFHAYEDTTSAKRGLAATLSAQPSTWNYALRHASYASEKFNTEFHCAMPSISSAQTAWNLAFWMLCVLRQWRVGKATRLLPPSVERFELLPAQWFYAFNCITFVEQHSLSSPVASINIFCTWIIWSFHYRLHTPSNVSHPVVFQPTT